MNNNKKSIWIVAKITIMAFLILVAVSLLPSVVTEKIQTKYVKENITIFEEKDFNKYLEKTASYYQFYYKKDPLMDNVEINENGLYLKISAYAISYYQKNVKNDMVMYFIHDAKYNNESFTKLKATLEYRYPVSIKGNENIYTVDQKVITQETLHKSFWAADAKNTDGDALLNTVKSVSLELTTKNETKKALLISDETKGDYLSQVSLNNAGLVKDDYTISANVADKMNNIPTKEEISKNNLYYQAFQDIEKLDSYNWISYLYFGLYSLGVLIVFYFFYIHKDLLNYCKERKTNK